MSYILQNMAGEHLGFLLLAGDVAEGSGDCIFRVCPMKAELFDTAEAGQLFLYHDLGEFQWAMTATGLEMRHSETGEAATLVGDVLTIQGHVYRAVPLEDS